jgi:hypothetical protein
MLCIASLFVAVGGCSDDDDVIQSQQVTADQAAALIEDAVPFIVQFGSDIADLLEAIYAKKAAGAGNVAAQQTCTPIPGLEAEYFCTMPEDGEVCPVDANTAELVFSNCTETAADPGTLDGTVTITQDGSSFDLLFDLDVDGGRIDGPLQVTLGECVALTYTGFVIEEGSVENTLDGTNTICPDTVTGTLNVSVNATGIQRFLMEIAFVQGIPSILIVSPTTQEPLYSCTYNPLTETADCFPFGDF